MPGRPSHLDQLQRKNTWQEYIYRGWQACGQHSWPGNSTFYAVLLILPVLPCIWRIEEVPHTLPPVVAQEAGIHKSAPLFAIQRVPQHLYEGFTLGAPLMVLTLDHCKVTLQLLQCQLGKLVVAGKTCCLCLAAYQLSG